MNWPSIKNPDLTVLKISVFLVVVLVVFFRWFGNGKTPTDIIRSDGRGYYAYLPAAFISHDLSFDEQVHKDQEDRASLQIGIHVVKYDNYLVNKYFTGVSILLLPFFLLALLASFLAGLPVDGYSVLFQMAVSIGAVFYLSAGLIFLRKLLIKFEFSKILIGLALLCVLYGTNLLYYAVFDPSMSHVYSFAAVSAFLYVVNEYFVSGKSKFIALSSVLLALIILIRPTNALIILLVPFFAGNLNSFRLRFFEVISSLKNIAFLILPALLILSIQVLYWYVATGEFLVWSYQGEGFYFNAPALRKFLIGFQKGWLIYTPLMFFGVLGAIFLFGKNIWQGIWSMLFLIVLIYISSSWWNWYYGDSFGQRVMVDFYPFMALLIIVFFEKIRNRRGLVISGLLILFLMVLNLVQTWQYVSRIIHPYSMNFEKYAYVFMKPDKSLAGSLGGDINVPPYQTNLKTPLFVNFHDFEEKQYSWKESCLVYSPGKAHSGKYAGYMDTYQRYSSAFILKNEEILYGRTDLYTVIELLIKDLTFNKGNDAQLVYEFRDCFGQLLLRNSYPLNDIPDNHPNIWRTTRFGFPLPQFQAGDQFKIFIWNKSGKRFIIDDFKFEVFGRKQG